MRLKQAELSELGCLRVNVATVKQQKTGANDHECFTVQITSKCSTINVQLSRFGPNRTKTSLYTTGLLTSNSGHVSFFQLYHTLKTTEKSVVSYKANQLMTNDVTVCKYDIGPHNNRLKFESKADLDKIDKTDTTKNHIQLLWHKAHNLIQQ